MTQSYFYQDNEPFTGRPVPYHKQNANQGYLKHFANSLYLKFFEQHETDPMQRRQARKEMDICDRKMNHWRRHMNFDPQYVGTECDKLRKMWKEPAKT